MLRHYEDSYLIKECLWALTKSHKMVSFFAYSLSEQSLKVPLRPFQGLHKVKTTVIITPIPYSLFSYKCVVELSRSYLMYNVTITLMTQ